MKTLLNIVLLLTAGLLLLSSCNNSNNDENNNTPANFVATQADLDAATIVVNDSITGNAYMDFSHNSAVSNADSTIRRVYTNVTNFATNATKRGTIITKQVYRKNPNGSQGPLVSAYAMISLNDQPGDWEWVVFNVGSVTAQHPNGTFTDQVFRADSTSTQSNSCVNCHNAAAGADLSFVN